MVLAASVVAGLIEKDVWALVLATGLRRGVHARSARLARAALDGAADVARRAPRRVQRACRRSCASASSSPRATSRRASATTRRSGCSASACRPPRSAPTAGRGRPRTGSTRPATGSTRCCCRRSWSGSAEHDHDAFDRTLLDTARYAALALLLVGAAAGGAAEGVMHIFGPGFAAGSDALAILLVTPALTVRGRHRGAGAVRARPAVGEHGRRGGRHGREGRRRDRADRDERAHGRGGRLRGGHAAAVRAPEHRRGATSARARAPLAAARARWWGSSSPTPPASARRWAPTARSPSRSACWPGWPPGASRSSSPTPSSRACCRATGERIEQARRRLARAQAADERSPASR